MVVNSWILKGFCALLKERFKYFIHLLYVISTFQLSIKEKQFNKCESDVCCICHNSP